MKRILISGGIANRHMLAIAIAASHTATYTVESPATLHINNGPQPNNKKGGRRKYGRNT